MCVGVLVCMHVCACMFVCACACACVTHLACRIEIELVFNIQLIKFANGNASVLIVVVKQCILESDVFARVHSLRSPLCTYIYR